MLSLRISTENLSAINKMRGCSSAFISFFENKENRSFLRSQEPWLTIRTAIAQLVNISNEAIDELADWATFLKKAFQVETIEGSIKLARLHASPRYKVITFLNSFHGRTFAAMTATAQPGKQMGFEPLLPGFSYATLNDLSSVQELVDEDTCAILVEPVQGEGGVRPCSKEFLTALRKLCDEKELALIFDEVQTTPARLGTWFGYQYFGVEPDILATAKAIASGFPMGVIMAKPRVAKSLVPGLHASTFGGSPLACAAAIATFQAIEEDGMLKNIEVQGRFIDERFQELASSMSGIKEVRRIGFRLGIELDIPGGPIVTECMDEGLRINCTQESVLRVLPAFNITREELAKGVDILERALKNAFDRQSSAAS